MPTLNIGAHNEYLKDGTVILWPGTTSPGGGVICNPGDLILKNRGPSMTYTSTDGLTTLSFGSYWDGSAFQPTIQGYHMSAPYYDGPYMSCAPTVDLTDDAFEGDIEIWADVSWTPDPATGKYRINVHSGDVILSGANIIEGTVVPSHFAPSHVSKGALTGASMRVPVGSAPQAEFRFSSQASTEALLFMTSDGSGDGYKTTAGSFFITDVAFGDGGTQFGLSPAFISTLGTYASLWDGGSPADDLILFNTTFPGSVSTASVTGGTGSLSALTHYLFRFCWWTNVTVNGHTKQVETPLSPPIDVTTGNYAGSQVSFTLPAAPTTGGLTWQLRIYYTTSQAGGTNGWPYAYYNRLSQNTGSGGDYTLSGSTVNISSVPTASTIHPSYGFSCWPAGLNLDGDPVASAYLMKAAHVEHTPDAKTNLYNISGWWGNTFGGASHANNGVFVDHFTTSNAKSGGAALTLDATDATLQTFKWAGIPAQTRLSVDGTNWLPGDIQLMAGSNISLTQNTSLNTITITGTSSSSNALTSSNGSLTLYPRGSFVSTGTAPSLSLVNSSLTSAAFYGAPNNRRGYVELVVGASGIAANADYFTITLVESTLTSTTYPYITITPLYGTSPFSGNALTGLTGSQIAFCTQPGFSGGSWHFKVSNGGTSLGAGYRVGLVYTIDF